MKRLALLLLGGLLSGCQSFAPPPSWALYGESTRLLVVAAPTPNDPQLKQQRAALEQREVPWRTYHLTAVAVYPDGIEPLLTDALPRDVDPTLLRGSLDLEAEGFTTILMESNGRILHRSSRPVSQNELVGLLSAPRRPAAPNPPEIRDWAHDW